MKKDMSAYKPRRPGTTMDDVVTPESRARNAAMVQEVKDEAASKAAGKAYDKAMPKAEKYAKGGSVRGYGMARGGKAAKYC